MPDVQLFVTCLVDAFAPEIGKAAVTLLEQAGCTVRFPVEQTCCGQPAHNAGHRERAQAMAKHTVEVLDRTTGPVVVPSGSCADMLIHHVPSLLSRTTYEPPARRVAGRVRELSCFLVDDLGVQAPAACSDCTVAYHPSCHGLRNLGIRHQPDALLAGAAARVDPRDPEQCCGFGGLFAIEMPDVSTAILDDRLAAFEESGADTVVGGDASCLMHIEGGLRRRGSSIRVEHLATFLARHLSVEEGG